MGKHKNIFLKIHSMHIVYHGPLLEYDGMEFSFPFKHICVLRNIYRIEILKS